MSDGAYCDTAERRAGGRVTEALRTEPLKARKVLTSSSSEKKGCRATRLMNLARARLLPSMKSRSETEVSTADGRGERDRKQDQTTSTRLVVD